MADPNNLDPDLRPEVPYLQMMTQQIMDALGGTTMSSKTDGLEYNPRGIERARQLAAKYGIPLQLENGMDHSSIKGRIIDAFGEMQLDETGERELATRMGLVSAPSRSKKPNGSRNSYGGRLTPRVTSSLWGAADPDSRPSGETYTNSAGKSPFTMRSASQVEARNRRAQWKATHDPRKQARDFSGMTAGIDPHNMSKGEEAVVNRRRELERADRQDLDRFNREQKANYGQLTDTPQASRAMASAQRQLNVSGGLKSGRYASGNVRDYMTDAQWAEYQRTGGKSWGQDKPQMAQRTPGVTGQAPGQKEKRMAMQRDRTAQGPTPAPQRGLEMTDQPKPQIQGGEPFYTKSTITADNPRMTSRPIQQGGGTLAMRPKPPAPRSKVASRGAASRFEHDPKQRMFIDRNSTGPRSSKTRLAAR